MKSATTALVSVQETDATPNLYSVSAVIRDGHEALLSLTIDDLHDLSGYEIAGRIRALESGIEFVGAPLQGADEEDEVSAAKILAELKGRLEEARRW